jgi:hypothetical protein
MPGRVGSSADLITNYVVAGLRVGQVNLDYVIPLRPGLRGVHPSPRVGLEGASPQSARWSPALRAVSWAGAFLRKKKPRLAGAKLLYEGRPSPRSI